MSERSPPSPTGWLGLTRFEGEEVLLFLNGVEIARISVKKARNNRTELFFLASPSINIVRKEVYERDHHHPNPR